MKFRKLCYVTLIIILATICAKHPSIPLYAIFLMICPSCYASGVAAACSGAAVK